VAAYTFFQSQYLAHLLTLDGDSADKLSRSISAAKIDLNPHQVDAAMFALRSPVSQGVILADEVGLGKTIEAALVIAQRWAEKRRRILLIVPASLRKQWEQELTGKFSLPCEILETKNYNQAKKAGRLNPFESGRIIISSYEFAANKSADLKSVNWDLVVFDEAHRLRNVFKEGSNKRAKAFNEAFPDTRKILLTATPLQNSLMELYGMVSVIDPHFFGSEQVFREQYAGKRADSAELAILKQRLTPLCKRTLRKQAQAESAMRFTNRRAMTENFTPSEDEERLYELVSAYLQDENIIAIPQRARHLVTLVIRKLLASSSFAIRETLRKMITRLETKLCDQQASASIAIEDLDDYETGEETAEEAEEFNEKPAEFAEPADAQALRKEIASLKEFQLLAEGIRDNEKGFALLRGLKRAFEGILELEGNRKAVIFTESRRTQEYLKQLLSDNGYEGKLVLLNGSNSDPDSQAIYKEWLARHRHTGAVSASKSANVKAAIVEAFQKNDDIEILISTESGAEGINLQFCSLVVNYDLPWNPQRVEQRIGRCHRYGQKNEVLVVNFINQKNLADQRVYQLLNEKFDLFNGVFGASDEILGAIESGIDIEFRILEIIQQCKSASEIAARFDALENEMRDKLLVKEKDARQTLTENVDEEVAQRFKGRFEDFRARLSKREQDLKLLTRIELPEADFVSGSAFTHAKRHYSFNWNEAEERGWQFYRLDGDTDSLAHQLADQAKRRQLDAAWLRFRYDEFDRAEFGGKFSSVEELIGRAGWLEVSKVIIQAMQPVESLLLTAVTDDGQEIDEETVARLLRVPVEVVSEKIPTEDLPTPLTELRGRRMEERFKAKEDENESFYNERVEQLDRWADEAEKGLELELKLLKDQIALAKKDAQTKPLREKIAARQHIKEMENRLLAKKLTVNDETQRLQQEKNGLIDELADLMKVDPPQAQPLFVLRWELC